MYNLSKSKNRLDDNKIEYSIRDIKEDNPTFEELAAWHKMSGLPLKKFFNTSGLLYAYCNKHGFFKLII